MSVICPALDEIDLAISEERSRESAFARSVAYALFSQLTAPGCPAAGTDSFLPGDLPWVLEEVEDALPYDVDFFPLARAVRDLTREEFAKLKERHTTLFAFDASLQYSRADLHIIYESFDYQPAAEFRQSPEHLSVLLEFMHCLAWLESRSSDLAARRSYQQTQRAFTGQYLTELPEQTTEAIGRVQPEPFHITLTEALDSFLRIDHEWQKQTMNAAA